MREALVRYFEENHRLVEAGALDLLMEQAEPLRISRRLVLEPVEGPFVTRSMVERMMLLGPEPAGFLPPIAELRASTESAAPPFELISQGFSPGPPGHKPDEAYEGLFRNRYDTLHRFLQGRPDLPNLTPIRELARQKGTVSIIGMIRNVKTTSERKHLVLEVDDQSGSLELLALRDGPVAAMSFLLDEVVGFTMEVPRESNRIPVARSAHRPEVPASRPARLPSGRGQVLFLSDLHLGSKSFLDESWNALTEFLAGHGARPELANEIRHVVIAGDLVDGIGVYPNQEADLAIHDVVEQYVELGRRLRALPDRLNIVAVPGNHDAVCPAEPQPALPPELAQCLPPNVRSIGNPSTFALEGVVVEAYHGRSFDDLIPAIPGASYARPTEVMKTMLAMRHLAPIYGGRTPLAPLPRDGMVIDPVPDILVTGHAHTFGWDRHRGILLLNASTWQAETEYQRMRNLTPVPARAAVVSLEDLSLTTLDFSNPDRPGVSG